MKLTIVVLSFLLGSFHPTAKAQRRRHLQSWAGDDDLLSATKLETLPDSARVVPGAYVVVFNKASAGSFFDAELEVADLFIAVMKGAAVAQDGAPPPQIRYEYKTTAAVQGVAVTQVSEDTLHWLLASDFVTSITPDYEFDLDLVQVSPESWGLDRIDEETLPMDGQYHYEHSGAGVNVYILDTGLYQEHIDFSTVTDWTPQHRRNVTCGYDAFAVDENSNNDESLSMSDDEGCVDTNGHGTHVAGIIGGFENGVAKLANLISVKVHSTDKGSRLSTVLAGLDYVMGQKLDSPKQPAIVNMSLGGPKCDLVNAAVSELVDAGVLVIVSAGNEATSSCLKSPASSEQVITVSATDFNDSKANFANFGLCTNLFAPGHQITSAWIRDKRDVARLSGTSLAAPHVAGVAAQYLEMFPHWTPQDVWRSLQANALRSIVTNLPPSTANLLLNTGDLRYPL